MEMEDIHASKRSRMGNGSGDGGGNVDASKAAQEQRQDEDEEDGEGKSLISPGSGGAVVAGVRGLQPWHQHSTASRIYRVSRASGGKDRHSKVMTAKGLRDRRVRLSVSTAIQFYDLQDRLGFDQPSKAIEWLINSAKPAIADLPSLDGAFPDDQPPPGRQPRNGEKASGTADEDEDDADISQLRYTNHHHLQHQQEERQHQQQQHLSLTKSTCSSTSETSKGSVLSLSRSEKRVKVRERVRRRTATAKDKDEDMEDDAHIPSAVHHQSMNSNPTSQSSFTELLTGGAHRNHTPNRGPITVAQGNLTPNFIHKQLHHLPTSTTTATTTDYFGQVGLLGTTGQKPHPPTIFPSQTHFGGSSPVGMVPFNVAAAAAAAAASSADHQELQQHYMQEHLIPFAVPAAGGDCINFSISSSFNRGTLQSNSSSPVLHHHLQMFSSPVDGANLPFFLGAAAHAASASGEGQLPAGFDSRLQLCYGGYRHSDLKGKGKN